MKTAARVIVPISLLAMSCSDTSHEVSVSGGAEQGYDMSRMDREGLCSSIRRVSKDAVSGFAALKAEERPIPGSIIESMSRVYREYQENETWFHMPGASDCHILSSIDRPPGKIRRAHYRCRWPYPTLNKARAAFRNLNRYIEICVDAENVQAGLEKDGQKVSWKIFRAPEATLNLHTAYHATTLNGEPAAAPVLELDFQTSMEH